MVIVDSDRNAPPYFNVHPKTPRNACCTAENTRKYLPDFLQEKWKIMPYVEAVGRVIPYRILNPHVVITVVRD